ncbi:MAG: GlsB/YeaQ/YmgE family stress response membrane protein [Oscillatoriophycideae cyanobacterium NC_groundwater_1537_Pr4_S-0.65um_50_18]|nr:GlsB/YeaQ/YmgE family stress response membrane protein [Oscillatoriophycideae cyanobacterium NC_groundwater_1537_Pr4_S-0.65um_50_18]
MSVLAWVILGLVAAALARLVNAGGDVFTTNVLGIIGALAGGYVGKVLLGVSTSSQVITLDGIVWGVLGALAIMMLWSWYIKKSA